MANQTAPSANGKNYLDIIFGSVAAALATLSGYFVGSGAASVLLGLVVGSVSTYVVQSRTQKRAWAREDRLFLVREIYIPLYKGTKELVEQMDLRIKSEGYALAYIMPGEKFGASSGSDWLDFASPDVISATADLRRLIESHDSEVRLANTYFMSPQFSALVSQALRVFPTAEEQGGTGWSQRIATMNYDGTETRQSLDRLLWHFDSPPEGLLRVELSDNVGRHGETDNRDNIKLLWEAVRAQQEVSGSSREAMRLLGEIRQGAGALSQLAESKVRESFYG